MVDRRQVACRLPMAPQWAASDREAECLAESYSESESLLERPTAEAKERAKRAAPAPATPAPTIAALDGDDLDAAGGCI